MISTFFKYQGTGNDFIMIDDRDLIFPANNHTLISTLCDRKFGIGADGLILLQPHHELAFYMKYYNSDGNESSMCGNGGRCLAAFAYDRGVCGTTTSFMAVDGPHEAVIEPEMVKLKMQDVSGVERRGEHIFILNTGSPHYVAFSSELTAKTEVVTSAREIRYNNEFAKEGINVNFVHLQGLKQIEMRTYERGVEDETLSCGTGVTAAALSTAMLNNLPAGVHQIDISTPGGNLKVSFDYHQSTGHFTNIWLQGPATFVFEGKIKLS